MASEPMKSSPSPKKFVVVRSPAGAGQKLSQVVTQSDIMQAGDGTESAVLDTTGTSTPQMYSIAGVSSGNTIIIIPAGSELGELGDQVVSTAEVAQPITLAMNKSSVITNKVQPALASPAIRAGQMPVRNKSPVAIRLVPQTTAVSASSSQTTIPIISQTPTVGVASQTPILVSSPAVGVSLQTQTFRAHQQPGFDSQEALKAVRKALSGKASEKATPSRLVAGSIQTPKIMQITVDPSKQTPEQRTLTLPPVLQTTMKTKKVCIEVEIDSALNVTPLDKVKLANGRTKYYFKIAMAEVKVEPGIKLGKRSAPTQKPDGTIEMPEDEESDDEDATVVHATTPKKRKVVVAKIQGQPTKYNAPKTVMAKVVVERLHAGLDKEDDVEDENEDIDDDTNEEGEMEEKGTGESDYEHGEHDFDNDDFDDHGDEDDDFGDEMSTAKIEPYTDNEEMEEEGEISTKPTKRGRKSKTPKAKVAKKATKVKKLKDESMDSLESEDKKSEPSPKRIYIKTNAYAKNDNYKMIKENGEKVFICNFCDWRTKYIVSVKDHVRNHLNEKPFICGVCAKAFSNQSNLNSHLARHYDSRPFECDLCDLAFKLKSSLNAHRKRHFEDRRFSCDICQKKVFTSTALKQHMTTHTDYRPFNCTECTKSFKTSALLTRHYFVHTGGGKFQCYLCGDSFVRKEYWRLHMKKRHNENVEYEKRKRLVRSDQSEVSSIFGGSTQEDAASVEQELTPMEQFEQQGGLVTSQGEVFVSVSQDQGEMIVSQANGQVLISQDGDLINSQGEVIVSEDGQIVSRRPVFQMSEGGELVIAQEGEGPMEQVAQGAEIVAVIGGEEDEELGGEGAESNVQELDKDTKDQVEYLVNLQYEYVKMADIDK